MKISRLTVLCGLAPLLVTGAAQAAPRHLDFDIWCTEEARIPYQRCAKRLPDDLKKFEAYRDVIEKYDAKEERERQRDLQIEHTVLDNEHVKQAPDTKSQTAPKDTGGNP